MNDDAFPQVTWEHRPNCIRVRYWHFTAPAGHLFCPAAQTKACRSRHHLIALAAPGRALNNTTSTTITFKTRLCFCFVSFVCRQQNEKGKDGEEDGKGKTFDKSGEAYGSAALGREERAKACIWGGVHAQAQHNTTPHHYHHYHSTHTPPSHILVFCFCFPVAKRKGKGAKGHITPETDKRRGLFSLSHSFSLSLACGFCFFMVVLA